MNTWYIEFSEGAIDDDGVDRTRRCLTTPEALSDFLHDKYGDVLCTNGIPAYVEASGWAEIACIDEEATFFLMLMMKSIIILLNLP